MTHCENCEFFSQVGINSPLPHLGTCYIVLPRWLDMDNTLERLVRCDDECELGRESDEI